MHAPRRVWKFHNQRYPHDSGSNEVRVGLAAKFAGCVSMVGSENDDAIVILAVCLQVGKEPAHALVDLAHFPGDSAVEAMEYSRRQRQIVLRINRYGPWLSVTENRLGAIRTIL